MSHQAGFLKRMWLGAKRIGKTIGGLMTRGSAFVAAIGAKQLWSNPGKALITEAIALGIGIVGSWLESVDTDFENIQEEYEEKMYKEPENQQKHKQIAEQKASLKKQERVLELGDAMSDFPEEANPLKLQGYEDLQIQMNSSKFNKNTRICDLSFDDTGEKDAVGIQIDQYEPYNMTWLFVPVPKIEKAPDFFYKANVDYKMLFGRTIITLSPFNPKEQDLLICGDVGFQLKNMKTSKDNSSITPVLVDRTGVTLPERTWTFKTKKYPKEIIKSFGMKGLYSYPIICVKW